MGISILFEVHAVLHSILQNKFNYYLDCIIGTKPHQLL